MPDTDWEGFKSSLKKGSLTTVDDMAIIQGFFIQKFNAEDVKPSPDEYKLVSSWALDVFFKKSQPDSESGKYLREVIEPKLRLLENAEFVAFVSDIALNTPKSSYTPEIQEELGTEYTAEKLAMPVMDRFRDLLIRLYNPEMKHKDLDTTLLKDMELNFNISQLNRAQIFSLVNDSEFMVKYQLMSLAKNHNYLGGVDMYMKQFARIVLSLGDQNLSQNLERSLNAEVAIRTTNNSRSAFLHKYK